MAIKTVVFGTVIVGALVFGLSACATMDQNQCQVVDWQQLGQTDGSQGRSQTYLSRHLEACSKYGIAVDQSAWNTGWNTGISSYCTFDNGVEIGRRGGYDASASCPVGQAQNRYSSGYTLGNRINRARTKVNNAQSRIDAGIAQLAKAESETARLTAQLEIERARTALVQAQAELSQAQNALRRAINNQRERDLQDA